MLCQERQVGRAMISMRHRRLLSDVVRTFGNVCLTGDVRAGGSAWR
jgi:hypothetical protein